MNLLAEIKRTTTNYMLEIGGKYQTEHGGNLMQMAESLEDGLEMTMTLLIGRKQQKKAMLYTEDCTIKNTMGNAVFAGI